MQLPTHEPPDSTSRVVCFLGPEWVWFVVSTAFAGLLIHHQISHLPHAWIPLPVLNWITAPAWVGWSLVLLVLAFALHFSLTSTVTIDPATHSVTKLSKACFLVPIHSGRRDFRDVAAIRCVHEGFKSGKTLRGPILAVFKLVLLMLFTMILVSYSFLPDFFRVVALLFAVVAEVILEWGTPTARLLFMDGRTWILTRGADHEVYRQARLLAKLLEVRVIS